jgi:hypothetical protein
MQIDHPGPASLPLASLRVATRSFRRPPQPGMTSPISGSASNSRCMAARWSSVKYDLTHAENSPDSMKVFSILSNFVGQKQIREREAPNRSRVRSRRGNRR